MTCLAACDRLVYRPNIQRQFKLEQFCSGINRINFHNFSDGLKTSKLKKLIKMKEKSTEHKYS